MNDVIATRDAYVAVGEGGVILTAEAAPAAVAPAARTHPFAKNPPGARDALGRSAVHRRFLLHFR